MYPDHEDSILAMKSNILLGTARHFHVELILPKQTFYQLW